MPSAEAIMTTPSSSSQSSSVVWSDDFQQPHWSPSQTFSICRRWWCFQQNPWKLAFKADGAKSQNSNQSGLSCCARQTTHMNGNRAVNRAIKCSLSQHGPESHHRGPAVGLVCSAQTSLVIVFNWDLLQQWAFRSAQTSGPCRRRRTLGDGLHVV